MGEWRNNSTHYEYWHCVKVNGQFYTTVALPLGKDPQVNFKRTAAWSPELFWMFWRRGKSLSLPAMET